MRFYYKNPAPERFIPEVRAMTKAGALKKDDAQPPVVAFLSQVMAANPKEISRWLEEFSDLDEKQKTVILRAAWFSNTEEANQYFQQHKLEGYLEEKAPDILKMEVNDPTTLDMLWGHFMATGKEEPIRRIVSALSLSKYAGSLDRFKTSEKTEKDKKEAYLDVIFQSAQWSLESNCNQHPLVLKHCEKIFADPNLPKDQSLWLGVVLSKVAPGKYKIDLGKEKGKKGD